MKPLAPAALIASAMVAAQDARSEPGKGPERETDPATTCRANGRMVADALRAAIPALAPAPGPPGPPPRR